MMKTKANGPMAQKEKLLEKQANREYRDLANLVNVPDFHKNEQNSK